LNGFELEKVTAHSKSEWTVTPIINDECEDLSICLKEGRSVLFDTQYSNYLAPSITDRFFLSIQDMKNA
jgi:hypothetical protein